MQQCVRKNDGAICCSMHENRLGLDTTFSAIAKKGRIYLYLYAYGRISVAINSFEHLTNVTCLCVNGCIVAAEACRHFYFINRAQN